MQNKSVGFDYDNENTVYDNENMVVSKINDTILSRKKKMITV